MKLGLGLFLAGHPRQAREPFVYIDEGELVALLAKEAQLPLDVAGRVVGALRRELDYLARRA